MDTDCSRLRGISFPCELIIAFFLLIFLSIPAFAQQQSFGNGSSEWMLAHARNENIRKGFGFNLLSSQAASIRSENGGTQAGYNSWNPDGIPHTPTLQAICYLFGFDTVVGYFAEASDGRWNYTSPKDNQHIIYDLALNDFRAISAARLNSNGSEEHLGKYKYRWLTYITCGDPIPACRDGWDNERNSTDPTVRDGKTDAKDPDCWTDRNDPNSYNPNDNNEFPDNCKDGLDNDGDSLPDENDPGCWDNPLDPGSYNPDRPDEGAADPQCLQGDVDTRTCSTPLPGECRAGTQTRTCQANYRWTAFGQCIPHNLPGDLPEVYNPSNNAACTDGKDNDCDGQTDGSDTSCYECTPGNQETISCSSGYPGICATGTKKRTCSQQGTWGGYGQCQPDNNPGQFDEVCNDNMDNDCDGKTDLLDTDCQECTPGDKDTIACSTTLPGICKDGHKTSTCDQYGFWGEYSNCYSNEDPQEESEAANNCQDGLDNDCNGITDGDQLECQPAECQPGESKTESCNSGYLGVCNAGEITYNCENRKWVTDNICSPVITPNEQSEICSDLIDNDCDGTADEDCSGPPSDGSDSCNIDISLTVNSLTVSNLYEVSTRGVKFAQKKLKRLDRNNPTVKKGLKFTRKAIISNDRHNREGTVAIAGYPKVVNTCQEIDCFPIDMAWEKAKAYIASRGIFKNLRRANRILVKASGKKNRKLIALRKQAKIEKDIVDDMLNKIPDVGYQCLS